MMVRLVISKLHQTMKSIWVYSGLRFFCKYSGFAYIGRMIKPKEGNPTFFIWLFGIYFAAYGIAAQIYENQLDRFEHKKDALTELMGTNARLQTFPGLVALQYFELPHEPSWSPVAIIQTIIRVKEPLDFDKVKDIIDLIVRFKDDLRGAALNSAILVGADLSKANLERAQLRYADLRDAYLNEANLERVDLRDAKLAEATLESAVLNDSWLWGADLRHANLTWAELRGVGLSGANLEGASLSGAELEGADLRGANLKGVDLRNADLRGVEELTCDQLTQANYWEGVDRDPNLACGAEIPIPIDLEANFEGADLGGANLEGANYYGDNFRGANLFEANLKGVDFRKANLEGADLRGADLQNVSFWGTNLQGANLSKSNLKGNTLPEASFKGVDLSFANFEAAYLAEANFEGANLAGASLKGADLTSADLRNVEGLTCEQLTLAKNWKKTYRYSNLACGATIPIPSILEGDLRGANLSEANLNGVRA